MERGPVKGGPLSRGQLCCVTHEEKSTAGFGSGLRSAGACDDRDAGARGARGGFDGDSKADIADVGASVRGSEPCGGGGDAIEVFVICAERGVRDSGDGAAAISDGGASARGAGISGLNGDILATAAIANRGAREVAAAYADSGDGTAAIVDGGASARGAGPCGEVGASEGTATCAERSSSARSAGLFGCVSGAASIAGEDSSARGAIFFGGGVSAAATGDGGCSARGAGFRSDGVISSKSAAACAERGRCARGAGFCRVVVGAVDFAEAMEHIATETRLVRNKASAREVLELPAVSTAQVLFSV